MPQLAIAQASLDQEVFLWVADGNVSSEIVNPNIDRRFVALSGSFSSVIHQIGLPDIVHDHGLWQPFHHSVARFCNKHNVVRVVSPRGMLEPWSLRAKWLKKKLALMAYQRRDLESATAIHVTAISEARNIDHLGLGVPIITHPNGVQLPPSDWTHPYFGNNPDDNRRVALYIGRLHPKKGLEMLMEAWSIVRPNNWRMHIIGPSSLGYRRALVDRAEKLDLMDDWRFEHSLHGNVKWNAFGSADIFILPTYSENFGIVVAEALACGTPVITTKGAPWAGLREHNCGWWVDPSTDALVSALRDAFRTSDSDLARMGSRGRDWVEQEFSWAKIAANLVTDYKRMLA